MGVSGAGKSTLGRALAEALGCTFCEGDDLHPRRNRDKMRHGRALTDADRRPWLAAIRRWIDGQIAAGASGVVSCSALRRRYRRQLREDRPETRLLFLTGSRRLIRRRLQKRRGHFMPARLLDSQFATLEPPAAHERPIVVTVGYGGVARELDAALRHLHRSAGRFR